MRGRQNISPAASTLPSFIDHVVCGADREREIKKKRGGTAKEMGEKILTCVLKNGTKG